MALFDIVFEGGGAKGSGFVGALEAFQQAGHTHRRLIGTSAGAITATLIAAGYSPRELLAAATERFPNKKPRFSSFMDAPLAEDFTQAQRENSLTMELLNKAGLRLPGSSFIKRKLLNALIELAHYRQLFSLVECGGFFSGNKFLEWIREKLAAKGIQPGTNFADFARQTEQDLSLVVSDTSGMEMLILNHRTAPDCPVEWAVRMSMSIPFVWREVVWKKEWGTYLGRPMAEHIIVDGGVLSNFPIRLIATANDPFIQQVMGNTDPQGAGNLGLLIDEKLPVPDAANQAPPELKDQIRTVQRVSRLVDTMTGAQDNAQIRLHEREICRVPALGYGTTEFDMDEARLSALIEGGRQAMARHLPQRP